MKFEEVVMAVASMAVTAYVIWSLLRFVFIPALGFFWGDSINFGVSFFFAALINGAIFVGEEARMGTVGEKARMGTIAKITILAAVLTMFWRKMDEVAYFAAALVTGGEILVTGEAIFVNVAAVPVLVPIGLYLGSRLWSELE